MIDVLEKRRINRVRLRTTFPVAIIVFISLWNHIAKLRVSLAVGNGNCMDKTKTESLQASVISMIIEMTQQLVSVVNFNLAQVPVTNRGLIIYKVKGIIKRV